MLNHKSTLVLGALLGFLGVGLGAFGAHALKPVLEITGRLDTYELAVRYQFYHVFAILLAGAWLQQKETVSMRIAASCFFVGVLLFSGSLYALALTSIRFFAFLTPIGGLVLMAGWASLLFSFANEVSNNPFKKSSKS